jgi:hypothetical protein
VPRLGVLDMPSNVRLLRHLSGCVLVSYEMSFTQVV